MCCCFISVHPLFAVRAPEAASLRCGTLHGEGNEDNARLLPKNVALDVSYPQHGRVCLPLISNCQHYSITRLEGFPDGAHKAYDAPRNASNGEARG